MANQFAQPTFLTGINDKLATVDTYAKNTIANVNNASSAFKNLQDTVQNILGGSKIGQDISKFGSDALAKIAPDAREITDRLSTMMPAIGKATDTFTAIKDMGQTVANSISAASNLYSKATAEINNIKAICDPNNFKSITSITSAINQLSSNNFPLVLQDAATMIGVKSAMIQQAVTLKIPGAITALTAGVTDAVELAGVIKGVSQSVVKNCDINALSEIANSPSCSHILVGQSPDILGDFAKKFTLPADTPATALNNIGNTITSTFNKLDAGWNTATRGVETLVNSTIISNGSLDFKTALRSADDTPDISHAVGMGAPTEVKEALSSGTIKAEPLINSIPIASIERIFPDGERPKDNMFNKWQFIGFRDNFQIYLNLYGLSPVYVKVGQVSS